MKIAVVGTGGTGGYFGGMLARASNDVTFIARGEHLQAIQRDGLTVKSVEKGDFTLPVKATGNTADVGPVDLVLFCVKGYDNAGAIPQLRPLVGPETMVLSVQNGMDSEQQIAEAVGEGAVLGAVAGIIAAIESPGVVAQMGGPGGGKITFGEMDGGTSPRTERLLVVMQEAGINAVLDTVIKLAIWDKFVGICAFSGVTSLTRLPIGPVMECSETRNLYRTTLEEVTALARAQDIPLPEDTVDNWINGMSGGSRPWVSSSMHHDLKVGRRLELEILNGRASRLGKELGVPTPTNDVIYAALAPYANGAPEVPLAP